MLQGLLFLGNNFLFFIIVTITIARKNNTAVINIDYLSA